MTPRKNSGTMGMEFNKKTQYYSQCQFCTLKIWSNTEIVLAGGNVICNLCIAEKSHAVQFDRKYMIKTLSKTFSRKWEISNNLIMTLLILLLSALFFISQGTFSMLQNEPNQDRNPYQNYIESVRSFVNSDFSDISKENRNLLRLIGEQMFLHPDEHAPLVIVIAGLKANEFSEKLNKAIQNSKSETNSNNLPIEIGNQLERGELHAILNNALASQMTPRTAVLTNIDLLAWDAVLVLHAFADHGTFPIPKTVLLLAVSTEETTYSGNSCDGKILKLVTNRWIENGGNYDNIPPIVARISYFMCL